MGMKDMSDTDPKAKPGPQPDAAAALEAERTESRRLREQVAKLQAANAEKDEQLAEERAVNVAMAQAMPMQPLDEPPEYELTAPFFSADCVLYPEGAVFRDTFGITIPNEFMIPLNAAADERYNAYMLSLPGGATPSLDLIIESAMEIRPREGDDPRVVAEYHGRVLQRALEKKYAMEGRLPRAPGEMAQPQRPKRPTRPDPSVPIMGGVRIRHLSNPGDIWGADSRIPAPAPARQSFTERVR